MKKINIKAVLLIVVCIGAVIFTSYNYSFYDSTIGTVTDVKNTYEKTRSAYDGTYEHKEKYYNQEITLELRNGKYKGMTLSAENHFAESAVYDIEYKKGDDVFVEKIKNEDGKLIGDITGTKRDFYVVLVLAVMACFFILAAGKDGVLTLLSLGINIVMFYFVLKLYLEGVNLIIMTIPLAIFFTALLLFFMYGLNEKTLVAFTAVLVSVGVTSLIAGIIIYTSSDIEYFFMDYLIQPYEKSDADAIFLSEILIGCLGAITDVVVTIVITVDQIMVHNPETEKHDLLKSCRAIGDDVIGTMLGIMFFTNIASAIPFILLSLRNGISFITILKYNSFFEIARFLTGSIGIVISIPVATFIAIYYYKHRKKVKTC